MARLFDVQNLTVSIKKDNRTLKILDNISFTIDEGEILGLAGESGCGKSITALSITNLLPPQIKITNGKIIYNNRDLVTLSEKELLGIRGNEISMIFQDVRQALNPLMKVGSQISEMLEIMEAKEQITKNREKKVMGKEQKNKNKEMVLEMLERLGFEKPLMIYETFPHQLSGGMCQRIMTAIAVISNPKFLIGDEPSIALDEESQKRCLSLLMEKNRNNGMSLLIISHDLSIIQQYCSRFLIMYAGKIVEEGPAETLFSPLHPYTKALVNAIPNKEKRGSKLKNISGKVPSIEDQLPGCPFAPRCTKAQNICKESFPPDNKTANRKVYCYFPEVL
ncbi:MAG: ABC transporter ATP-binding protein [Treponema sp.]|nr:ABC transporter ATP-binding protein [Treponema sp.]